MNFHNSHVEENPLPPGHREKLELKQEFKICSFNLHSMSRGQGVNMMIMTKEAQKKVLEVGAQKYLKICKNSLYYIKKAKCM